MAEGAQGHEAAPEAEGNASRALAPFLGALRGSERLGLLVLGLGAVAGLLMIATEVSTIVSIEVVTASCEDLARADQRDDCVKVGAEQHLLAMALLGLLAIAMAWGAGVGASRPAAAALLAVGVAVLAIAAIGDLPDVRRTGEVGANFDEAEAKPGLGFFFELGGAALAIVAGAVRLVRRGGGELGSEEEGPEGAREGGGYQR